MVGNSVFIWLRSGKCAELYLKYCWDIKSILTQNIFFQMAFILLSNLPADLPAEALAKAGFHDLSFTRRSIA